MAADAYLDLEYLPEQLLRKNLLWRAQGNLAPTIQYQYLVGDTGRQVQVVYHQHHGAAALGQLLHRRQHLLLVGQVQGRGGFIQQ